MKLGLVLHPFSDRNLCLAKQIGVSEVVYCDINDNDQETTRRFPEADELIAVIGFSGVIRPDHVPKLEGESGTANGYTLLGRLYAVGYLRGIAESVGIPLT